MTEPPRDQPADPLPPTAGSASIAPAAPPTQRGTAPRHKRPPMWPTVIGTISIILGASAVLVGVFGALTTALVQGVPARVGGITPRVVMLTTINAGLGALVALVLIAAGIQTCRRRANGRALHITWAVLKIVYAVVASILGYLTQREQFAAMAAADTSAGSPGMYQAYAVGGSIFWVQLVLGVLWYAAYPIFILIWFNTRNAKQDCAAWK
jgi:hypothetical protein